LRTIEGSIIETMPAAGRKMMYTSGWPKNQKRCCHSSASPPLAATKKGQPNARSSSSSSVARMTAGNANTTITAKVSIAHAKTGMRPSVMPGARVRRMPTMISIAPAMAEISMNPMPSSQKSSATPGENTSLVSGGFMNQPPRGASPKKRLVKNTVPPIA
jgi:hypothetical protein